MTLIKSISGIRGTIGGHTGEALTPVDVLRFTAGFGKWINKQAQQTSKVVVGRDARPSGDMFNRLVVSSLQSLGIDVIDVGRVPTPTVEIAVVEEEAAGGIVITASHNPNQWNALKFLNGEGEFISKEDAEQVLKYAEARSFDFVQNSSLGSYTTNNASIQTHIEKVIDLPLVDTKAIKQKDFKVAIDCINSVGSFALPPLLEKLGVEDILKVNCEPDGQFAHNPEPLPENLSGLVGEVNRYDADLGIVVDPDVDRLAFVCEDGTMFGEEYTLVAVADYILQHKKGAVVSNVSSTRALQDITDKRGGTYHASAVGELNVVEKMKEVDAIIGGEGNGGVIYPELHYGRDALVGIGLFLSHLAHFDKNISVLRSSYPKYHMLKSKIPLDNGIEPDSLLEKVKNIYNDKPINTEDGVKIYFDKEWVHLRKSNTEPIIRVYAEGESETTAQNLSNKLFSDIKSIIAEEHSN